MSSGSAHRDDGDNDNNNDCDLSSSEEN